MAITYEPIATTTLNTTTTTITFSSISSAYTDLVLIFAYKSASTNYPTLKLTVNGSSTGYSGTQLYGNGSSAGSNRNTNASFISIARAVGQPNTVGGMATVIINFQNYANTSTYKTILARASAAETGTEADVGLWQSTSAINQIDITTATGSDFASGSMITLYGIKAA